MIQRLIHATEEGSTLPPTALCGSSLRSEHAPAGDARSKLCLALVPRIPKTLSLDLLTSTLPPARHHIAGTAFLVCTADAASLDYRGRGILFDEVAGVDS